MTKNKQRQYAHYFYNYCPRVRDYVDMLLDPEFVKEHKIDSDVVVAILVPHLGLLEQAEKRREQQIEQALAKADKEKK